MASRRLALNRAGQSISLSPVFYIIDQEIGGLETNNICFGACRDPLEFTNEDPASMNNFYSSPRRVLTNKSIQLQL